MFKVNFKKWIFPGLFLLVLITIVSCIVTKSQQNRTEEIIEGLSNPPTVSTKNLSTEKAKLLFPYLRAYLLSNYPTRKSVTSDDDKEITVRWEDLSGNKNDFIWTSKPKLSKHKGFHTKDNVLQGPSTGFIEYGNTHEFTIILRVALVQKDTVQTEVTTPTDIGEVIANADLSNKGNKNSMTINVPATIKEKFENLKEGLKSDNQNQETLKTILVNAGQIKNILDSQPNKGKKQLRSPVALVMYSNQGKAIEVRVPNGVGNLEVDVNGVPTTNIQKMSSLDDAYYTIVYKKNNSNNSNDDSKGHLKAYVNTTKVIDEDVGKIVLDTNKEIVINPSGNLNVGLEEIGVLNRALSEKEIGYFLRSDIILRTILDQTSYDYSYSDTFDTNGENKHKNKCPKVYRDSEGNYIIRGVSYGKDRRVAREIYRINFPNCRNIPSELDDWYNKEIILEETCPFVVDSQFNPCKFYACENVNWEAPNPKKAGMNHKCRKRVDAYCEEHAYLDPFCYCWRSENYDLPQCVKFRSKFNNPRDRGCSAADFPIEENPDFDKYIKKDRIPCWGCTNLNE